MIEPLPKLADTAARRSDCADADLVLLHTCGILPSIPTISFLTVNLLYLSFCNLVNLLYLSFCYLVNLLYMYWSSFHGEFIVFRTSFGWGFYCIQFFAYKVMSHLQTVLYDLCWAYKGIYICYEGLTILQYIKAM